MKKKIVISCIIIALLIALIAIYGAFNNKVAKENISKITINIYDKENTNIYEKNLETEKKYLIDVLKDIEELKIIYEDGQYGAYITSIMDIKQEDDYYWSYYINDEYATTGISNCKIEDGKEYDFKIEKFNY